MRFRANETQPSFVNKNYQNKGIRVSFEQNKCLRRNTYLMIKISTFKLSAKPIRKVSLKENKTGKWIPSSHEIVYHHPGKE